MANHVYFNITSDEPMENCFKEETVTRDYGNGPFEFTELANVCYQPFMQEAMKDEKVDAEGWPKDSWNWHVDNCGAKWVNLEDADESYLTGYSAWSPPIEMLEHLGKFLGQELRMTYEDEFRNFFGYYDTESFNGTVVADHYEIEDSEFVECLEGAFGKEYNENEDFEWWEEYTLENGNTVIPSEFADEVVYNFFITKELQLPE